MSDQRFSDNDVSRRDVPSFIEPHPPLISNPFMRPKPQKATNLLKLFEEDSESEEAELVQVYLRLKPCNIFSNLYEVRSDRCLITSLDTVHGRRTQHNVSKMYTFSHIFGPDASQKEIFENVVKDNLKKLPMGHSFTLLTYGASGSGKTYTLMGTVGSPGLVPRSLEYVFNVVDAAQRPLYKPSEGGADKLNNAEQEYELKWVNRLRHISAPLRDKYRRMSIRLRNDLTSSTADLSNRTRYYVWVSFVEIYNESIYDLLAPGDRRNASKLLIREDSNGNVYVKGATQAFVRTGEEAYDVMVAGKHNLQVAATGVHAQSSRSHCIFTITMLTHTDEGVRVSCVRLCDLAGCERARRTRNTGARMQESRAINSSLHVLERCLHTLRRKQRATKHALVPYRESKLTRLLGAGLSGARGEAVSMVVTLNPSPEYAHETKHVLQLAAVARDIQINNTISEFSSSLETSQDSTMQSQDSSAEIASLRAENERLHYVLIQTQSRNEKLLASMAERQENTAETMRSLVEQAKEMTRNYYETQLRMLRNDMEEMREEYESKLCKVVMPPNVETSPNKTLQNKITQLMTEIAILQEKLSAEQLARARAEEEVQHLRACIEERDENTAEEDVVLLNNSDNEEDSDEEEDICNESLEPTFAKEDINRSRLIRQSTFQDDYNSNEEKHSVSSAESVTNSVLEISTDTVRSDKIIGSLDNTYVTGNESDLNKEVYVPNFNITPSSQNIDLQCLDKTINDDSEQKYMNSEEDNKSKDSFIANDIGINSDCSLSTGAIGVMDSDHKIETKSDVLNNKTNTNNIVRETYFVSESKIEKENVNNSINEELVLNTGIKQSIDITNKTNATYDSISDDSHILPIETKDIVTSINIKEPCLVKDDNEEILETNKFERPREASDTLVGKIISSLQSTTNSNNSLAQFEQLENATRERKSYSKVESQEEFCNIKLLKDKRIYFDDSKKEYQIEISKSLEQNTYFDNIGTNIEKVTDKRLAELWNEFKNIDNLRSPSIVKEDIANDFEPSTIKRLLGESMTRIPEPVTVVKNKDIKYHDSIDIFESPIVTAALTKQKETIDKEHKSIVILNSETENGININKPIINIEPPSLDGEDIDPDERKKISGTKSNEIEEKPVFKSPKNLKSVPSINASNASVYKNDNTLVEFENIYNNITAPRATEFDLLVSQEGNVSQINEIVSAETSKSEEVKYNLRHKSKQTNEINDDKKGRTKHLGEEVLLESHAKCESQQTTRRNLRLRRRKNMIDDESKEEEKQFTERAKLKDIINLQSEFSDVTIGVPAPVKQLKDIPTPEKNQTEVENLAPLKEIQSCPSKSVTRSRRKLFTPRAEPLEESMQGESGERVRVPRPSYHRPRARRKL